ncbi:hypothetical protein MKEN_00844400 [Mycena kentingensis (nom. inval.)]|nr:hypothetical protein MKEN_00844400 [Mycena kentingensis (nom. inval.)]
MSAEASSSTGALSPARDRSATQSPVPTSPHWPATLQEASTTSPVAGPSVAWAKLGKWVRGRDLTMKIDADISPDVLAALREKWEAEWRAAGTRRAGMGAGGQPARDEMM